MSAKDSPLARRLSAVSISPTLAVMMEARALKEKGVDVIDFGPGEPDFDTPANIKRAAIRALENNLTHYTDTGGVLELRRAIAERYKERYSAPWGPDEVITGCGGKNVLFLTALALFEPGDRVAIYAPYWVSFPEQVKLTGAEPVILQTRETKPSSSRVAACAARTGAFVISDETYDCFHYGPGSFASFASEHARLRDRLVVVNSFSKTYAMTGWRVGYALGPRSLIEALRKVQSHDATHTSSISQAAALEALTGPQDSVASMREEYRGRRDELVRSLNRITGVTCTKPPGSFYVFPNVRGAMTALDCATSVDLAKRLMTEIGVATVPGEAFGFPGHLRLSYALSLERLRAGVERLHRLLGARDA